jgi:hypothetical protein
MVSLEVSNREGSSSLGLTLLSCLCATIFVDSIAFLDKLEVGGKLIKILYFSILEKIRRKVFLDNFDELTNSIKFCALFGVVDWEARAVECEIFIYPKGKGVEIINSDVIMCDEKEAVF